MTLSDKFITSTITPLNANCATEATLPKSNFRVHHFSFHHNFHTAPLILSHPQRRDILLSSAVILSHPTAAPHYFNLFSLFAKLSDLCLLRGDFSPTRYE
jgi:hypothetical protein